MSYTLVIGGNGFIGRYVCDVLIGEGKKVVIAGRSIKPLFKYNKQCTYVSTSEVQLQDIIDKNIEIIDLSYSISPGVNSADAVINLITNVKFSLDVFNESIKKNIKKIVFVSSGGSVYGNHGSVAIKESFKQQPISSYGIIKSTIERYAYMYYINNNLPIVIVRPSNAYGIGQKINTGQGFITAAINSLLTNTEISIYGDSGTIRDYIHVSDVARGIVTALNRGNTGEAYNISSGIGTSNIEILQMLNNYTGINSRLTILPKRKIDVDVNILDNSKLIKETNWKPTISITDGIVEMRNSFTKTI